MFRCKVSFNKILFFKVFIKLIIRPFRMFCMKYLTKSFLYYQQGSKSLNEINISGPEVVKKSCLTQLSMKFSKHAYYCKNIKKFSLCQPQISLECFIFFLLIYVKMPTTVGILTLYDRKNCMLSLVEHENFL